MEFIECPYCGEYNLLDDWSGETEFTHYCEHCEHEFKVIARESIVFQAEVLDYE